MQSLELLKRDAFDRLLIERNHVVSTWNPDCAEHDWQFREPAAILFGKESYMAKKRIGILTGGGDVPGLNSVIKSVVYRGQNSDAMCLVSAGSGKD